MQRKQAIKLYIFTDTHSQNNVKKKNKTKNSPIHRKSQKGKISKF